MAMTQLEPSATLAELEQSKPERVTIVVLSGDMDRVMAAFIIATGAAVIIEVVTRKDDATRNDIKNIFPVAGGSTTPALGGAISGVATAPPDAPF
jgi:hypothetical protein